MNNIIDELLIVKQELDTKSDFLTNRIIEFENELNKLGMGLGVWIATDSNTRLGYIKFEKAWHLVVESIEDGEKYINILAKSRRTLRLHGYKHMHKLLPALLETAKKFCEKIDTALLGKEE